MILEVYLIEKGIMRNNISNIQTYDVKCTLVVADDYKWFVWCKSVYISDLIFKLKYGHIYK